MKSNFVLTIEQMQTLIDKGLDCSNATFAYEYGCESNLSIKGECSASSNDIPAFSLQDMLDIMPHDIKLKDYYYAEKVDCELMINCCECKVFYEFYTWNENMECESRIGDTLLESTYNMLLWLIDNGHVKVDKGC